MLRIKVRLPRNATVAEQEDIAEQLRVILEKWWGWPGGSDADTDTWHMSLHGADESEKA